MKRTIICAALSLGMILPGVSQAHGFHGGGYGYGHGGGFARAAFFPLVLGAAAIGAVATIATAPFYAAGAVAAPPPAPVYYGPQPAAYGYAPYGYGYAQPVCTYYPNGARYCR